MSSTLKFLESSIGRKVLVALTGLFLCTFLIVHVSGNLQLFHHDEGLAFNKYSLFMTTFFPIKIVSYLLYASILLHAFVGIRLALRNLKARPVVYLAPKDTRSSTWASKNMALLGTIVLIFFLTHMANFWFHYKFGNVPWKEYRVDVSTGMLLGEPILLTGENIVPADYITTGDSGSQVQVVVVRDLYEVVKLAFQETWIVVLYLLSMIALAYHLVHGFQSSFQTLGLRHPTYTLVIRGIGVWIFGIVIPILFAAMPVYFFFFVK
jgi:succinate dehydrogenase / fumarate reductase, cytochrome b subunit